MGILDVGNTEDHQQYLVLRYVKGPTLRKVLTKPGKLSSLDATRLASQLADALDACHRLGILHLDLKPENIILKYFGGPAERATIVDFGTAEILGQEQIRLAATAAGRKSQDRYRAPELIAGERPTARCDIFSLGVVLAEAIEGEQGRPNTSVPKRWNAWLAKAINGKPECRFQSVAELQKSIPQPKNRNSQQLWLIAAGVTLAILAAIPFRSASLAISFPKPVPFTSLPGEETYPSFSPDGEKLFFAWSPEYSGQSDIYVKALSTGETVRLTNHLASEFSPACSKDGKLLAFFRDEGHGVNALVVMPVSGGLELEITRGMYHSFSWAPDNRSVALTYARMPDDPMRIRLVDIQTKAWRDLTAPPDSSRGDQYPAFSPDGRSLVFSRVGIRQGPGEIYIQELSADLSSVGSLRQITHIRKHIDRPNFTSSGKGILFAAGTPARKSLWYVPADGSSPPVSIPEAGDNLESLRVSPTSMRLAFTQSQADMNIWRLDLASAGGEVVSKRPIISSTWDDEEHKLSKDGMSLAFVSMRSGREQVWLASTDGTRQRQVTRLSSGDNLQVHWAPDGTRLLLTGMFNGAGHSYLVYLADGNVSEIGGGLAEIGTGISRDGSSIYFHSLKTGSLRLWRMPIRGGPAQPVTNGRAEFSAESVDGSTLYFSTRRNDSAVWQSKGIEENKIIDRIARRAFAVGRTGIYYLSNLNAPVLRFYRFSDSRHINVFRLEKRPGFGLDVSSDERTVYFSQFDRDGSDLMLIEGFQLP